MGTDKKTILIAEDDASIRMVVSQTLLQAGYEVRATASADALEKWVRADQGDVVITDVYLGQSNIFDRLNALRLARRDLPFIIMSGQNTILTAASAADHGAFDYLPKPFDLDELVALVARALKNKPGRISPPPPPSFSEMGPGTGSGAGKGSAPYEVTTLIGRSVAMQGVYRIISRVMNTPLTVLIEGEAGTGKESVARSIHALGQDSGTTFSSPDFKTNLPTHGVVYVDEVGDLSSAEQDMLLQFMRSESGARLIVATRRNLSELVGNDEFRGDLFHRLNVVRLTLPPLRHRKEDIEDLVKEFLQRAKAQGLPEKMLEPGALKRLSAHDWPGNVRELENLIFRLCALCPAQNITAQDVDAELALVMRPGVGAGLGLEQEMEALIRKYVMADLSRPEGEETAQQLYSDTMAAAERPLLQLALTVTAGNKVRAAKLLGMNRNTLRARLQVLGLE